MKVLVTGANGFVGRNTVETLLNIKNESYHFNDIKIDDVFEFDKDSKLDDLKEFTKSCDFIINLAGVNRPKKANEFYEGNKGFIEVLCSLLIENNNKCPILISSSIQVGEDNDYAKSKKEGEDYILDFSKNFGNPVYIYRFANLFGKWCKPNYNSVTATWCHNIARNNEIVINDPSKEISLCYIDDVINEILNCMKGKPTRDGLYFKVEPVYKITLENLANYLYSFKSSRKLLDIPNQSDPFIKKLYATYLSYIPDDNLSYPLNMNMDERGSFTEFIKTKANGQVSVNISKPGIIKGNHWHQTKNEKFLVVSGEAIIRFRKIGDKKISEYKTSGEKLEVVDIPVGYTHNIENIGKKELVTIMWANEPFDTEQPDTFYEEV